MSTISRPPDPCHASTRNSERVEECASCGHAYPESYGRSVGLRAGWKCLKCINRNRRGKRIF